MRKLLKIAVVVLVVLALTSAAFGAGIFVGQSGFWGTETARAQNQPPEFNVFWEVWNLTEAHFIDRDVLKEPQKLVYGAISGFIEALGDEGHTRFLTPTEVTQQKESISGSFFGIGAQVGMKDGMPVIVAPFDGSPAQAAGVKAGDIIIEVNGEDVTGLTLNDTVSRIRGEKGTTVVLTLYRADENKSLEISIVRDEIKIPAASWAMVPGTKVGLIRLSQFNGNLDDNLREIIQQAQTAGATAYILDVRNNPGGLLEQAIKVTSEFVKDGNVLLQEDTDGNRKPFPIEPGGIATDIPVVVLVNRGSASSSEIFAGALQDHQRGKLIGETTFGTGTVLQPFDLSDGSSLLLGTSQWLTPNGRLIRKHGIEPDVKVELPVGANLIAPAELREMSVKDLLKSEDKQLLKALEELNVTPSETLTEKNSPELGTAN